MGDRLTRRDVASTVKVVPETGPEPPAFRPMLTGGTAVPADPHGWHVEPKWDGVRAIITIHRGRVRLASRNDNDVTAAYPELVQPPPILADRSAVLDGEVIAVDGTGRPNFGVLQRRMHVRRPPASLVEEVPVSVMLFDLLWLDGEVLVGLPLRERRRRLDGLGIAAWPWLTTPLLDFPPGDELLSACRQLGLEGFVVKRLDASYSPGRRSDSWQKVKCLRRREFVVGGWSEGKGRRSGGLGSLALGVYDRPVAAGERRLLFVGMAGSGLSNADVDAFRGGLQGLARPTSPFANPTPPGIRFLEPVLVAEITFTEVTAAGTLRHPVLAGFRTDLSAVDVVVDSELAELGR